MRSVVPAAAARLQRDAAPDSAGDGNSNESEAALAALVNRRDQLKELVALEIRRGEHHEHAAVKKEAARLQRQLAAHREKIEAEISALLAASPVVNARVVRLTQIRGIGTVSAYSLLAHLPELGKLPRGAIAALAGVAPMNADGDAARGARHIRGGRASARKALYMAALCATLHNPLIKSYYQALRARGKPAKVALTAVMRKLLLHLNAILKTPLGTAVELSPPRVNFSKRRACNASPS